MRIMISALLFAFVLSSGQQNLYGQQKAMEIIARDVKNNKHKISDLYGKVVYIDVWASWCGPCKREIPHLKELEDKFKDQKDKIAFVSISIDKSPSNWQKAVQKYDLNKLGLQLIDIDKVVSKNYRIYAIPRFILIGKKGELLLINAPRPSSGRLIEKILQEAITG